MHMHRFHVDICKYVYIRLYMHTHTERNTKNTKRTCACTHTHIIYMPYEICAFHVSIYLSIYRSVYFYLVSLNKSIEDTAFVCFIGWQRYSARCPYRVCSCLAGKTNRDRQFVNRWRGRPTFCDATRQPLQSYKVGLQRTRSAAANNQQWRQQQQRLQAQASAKRKAPQLLSKAL